MPIRRQSLLFSCLFKKNGPHFPPTWIRHISYKIDKEPPSPIDYHSVKINKRERKKSARVDLKRVIVGVLGAMQITRGV